MFFHLFPKEASTQIFDPGSVLGESNLRQCGIWELHLSSGWAPTALLYQFSLTGLKLYPSDPLSLKFCIETERILISVS